ncbi:MAG: hypothetical protein K9G76_01055 [Bacteroidales bacterium]|nr:hypothetical protein [Bacteroidales bacterium]MCF8402703.1 hypothetical protein [Bacteroidales bacterium]
MKLTQNFLFPIGIVTILIILSGFTWYFSNGESPIYKLDPLTDYDSYDKDWKKVDSLIQYGLPKSALELTENIFNKAKKDHNHPQFIKATIYKIKLTADFNEAFIEKAVKDLNDEIKVAKEPTLQILHSLLADIYWRYYQANRYRFMERTEITGTGNKDLQTWDLKTLMHAIITNYYASLNNPDILKKTNLNAYNVILTEKEGSKKTRPSLYDFLAHRAIDFFMNDESGFIQPADRFEIDKEFYFSQPGQFSAIHLNTKDSLSLKFYALELLQELTAYHLNDKEADALVDVNLKRLNFVYDNATLEIKDSLFLKSLVEFEKTILSQEASTEVSHQIGAQLYQQSLQYKPLESVKHKWDAKAAIEKCDDALKRFPESFGAKNCKSLKEEIERITFSIMLEKENLPDRPILSLLNFKNLSKVYFRLVMIDYNKNRELEQGSIQQTALIKKYLEFPVVSAWELDLPNDGDFQQHRTEFKIPSLNFGYYVLLASDSKDFKAEGSNISHQTFWVTNISYINHQYTSENIYRFYILNRQDGAAISGVRAKIFYRNYDYRQRENIFQEGGTYYSDENGYFEISATERTSNRNSFFIEFSKNNDTYITDDRFYQSVYQPGESRKITNTYFFTDRAIYRPGQTIYFKGIVLERFKDENGIVPGQKTSVELMDVNYQKVGQLELVANEYGSFNGSFTAPQGGLNGRMTIKNETGSQTILVEEYKRPKFEVTFNPIEGSYKLNNEIKLEGTAKAFAGNSIAGAEVKYRVVRETYYPWRFFYFDYFPPSSSLEITNGTTITDDDGNFRVSFIAQPDLSIIKKYNPAFNYTVYADVTDVNNETQSGKTYVNVGYKALQLDIGIGEVENIENFKSFTIKTTNLNGQPLAVNGKIEIALLEEPEGLLREKLWENPDLFVMERENYEKDFPNDNYKNENKADQLKIRSVIAKLDFDTKTDSVISLDQIKKWQEGRYALTVNTTDNFGEEVILKEYFILYSEKSKKAPVNELNWFHVIKNTCEPGEKASFIIGSKEKNVHVLYEIVQKENVLSTHWINLNDEQKRIEIPVTESQRGGFGVNVIFVNHNRSFNNSFLVTVPFTNKKLDFEFASFREKIKPGDEEEWSIKINGPKGEKLAAELLTAMYDASLDKFQEFSWNFNLFTNYYSNMTWSSRNAFNSISQSQMVSDWRNVYRPVNRMYDQLNWFGFNYFGGSPYLQKRMGMEAIPEMAMNMMDDVQVAYDKDKESETINKNEVLPGEMKTVEKSETNGVQVRRDFRETAFFYPSLKTDENGNVIIRFTAPESLTRWKMMGMAHTKDLKYGLFTKEVMTQKELMVVPNPPRFFRKGDKMSFSAKVSNLSDKELNGEVVLQFFDTRTMEDVSGKLILSGKTKTFKVAEKGNQNIEWEMFIPEDYDLVSYRIIAKSEMFSDGEESPVPVLSNRMLVTESLPLPVNGNETKKFVFTKLVNSKPSGQVQNGLVQHKLSLEFSSNPAWYAVQALPYVMENNSESAESAFYRFYANSIASYLVNSSPRIKQVFDAWKNFSADALLSNLEKNQELKSLILNETPWVRDAKNETERKHRIAILFDINKMTDEQNSALRKLIQKQSPGGGWPWYKGMPDNRYISQLIVSGFAHLKQLGIYDAWENLQTKNMVNRAIQYLDYELKKDYDRLTEYKYKLEENHLGNTQIQYLYARSYFLKEVAISRNNQVAFDYYHKQAKTYWHQQGNLQKGMIALALKRLGDEVSPIQVMASIKEHALYSEEMGMYWRDNSGGYYWYEAPIETQALLIEAFHEVAKDQESVEKMKMWLLKQKQTQDWKTPRATADAIYALLLRGNNWLANSKLAEISLGDIKIDPLKMEDTKVEAGTGYFKTSWTAGEIKPEMGKVTVTNKNESLAWGAVYWQYFENLEDITFAETPLKLEKKLFLEENTAAGPVLRPISEQSILKPGNKVIVRIELRVDRDMEFVHMKDMRASAFEPVNVLSSYHYQDGLGYYETTLDASTNFFFDYLRKGTYIFEYPLIVSQKGDFSNGISTIQCMYAPEFTSHSDGVRVKVE